MLIIKLVMKEYHPEERRILEKLQLIQMEKKRILKGKTILNNPIRLLLPIKNK